MQEYFQISGSSFLSTILSAFGVRRSEEDLLANLKRANIIQLLQVRAVVFEKTGEISVLHSDNSSVELQHFIITNVKQ